MEKFQKYCLSVLLVIMYSNAPGQISNDSVERNECIRLCEVINTFLDFSNYNENFSVEKKKITCKAIHQRLQAADVAAIAGLRHDSGFNYSKFKTVGFEFTKYDKALGTFEKNSKPYGFAESIHFKSKVSKIRNKDYLDLVS